MQKPTIGYKKPPAKGHEVRERIETYVIPGKRGSGEIALNGPAARKVAKDDIVIIISYATLDFEEAKTFEPTVIFPNETNNSLI